MKTSRQRNAQIIMNVLFVYDTVYYYFSIVFSTHCLCLLLLVGFDVGLNKELRKEHKETENVHNVTCDDTQTGGFALRDEQVSALRHHGDELDHLHHGQT